MSWLLPLLSVVFVSLASFVGLFTLAVSAVKLQRLMFALISFAAGALLGDTFLHIMPEIVEKSGFTLTTGLWLLAAFVLFFVLENGIHWHHYHHVGEDDRHPVGVLNLVGDGLHNFIDGVIIGVAYLVDVHLGIVTTLAVIFHEIPQEIGDFSILIYSGFSKVQALWFNFLSALTAVVGTLLALWFGQTLSGALPVLLTITAGGFIYIAAVDLIPELHKEVGVRKSVIQFASMLGGIGLMLVLKFVE
jgi:zinc and cadmium transporter